MSKIWRIVKRTYTNKTPIFRIECSKNGDAWSLLTTRDTFLEALAVKSAMEISTIDYVDEIVYV